MRSKNTVKLYRYLYGRLRLEAKGVLYLDGNFIHIEGRYSLQLDVLGIENVNLDMSKRLHIKYYNTYYEFVLAKNESVCKWYYIFSKYCPKHPFNRNKNETSMDLGMGI